MGKTEEGREEEQSRRFAESLSVRQHATEHPKHDRHISCLLTKH